MKTHPLSVAHLVVGIVYLGIALSFALDATGVVEAGANDWLLPTVLLTAGLAGLAATLALGSGAATIIASPAEDYCGNDNTGQQIWGGSGSLFFVGGSGPATIFGGTGSATIYGGDGPSEFHGGRAGNNEIYAGTGRATVYGGGDGDILYAEGDRRQELHAGPGAATLFGALGGIEDDELRATFNGGIGMVAIVAADAVPAAQAAFAAQGLDAPLIGKVVPVDELGGRYAEGPLEGLG